MSEQTPESGSSETPAVKTPKHPPLVLAEMKAQIVKPAVVAERKRKVNRPAGERKANQLAIDKLVTAAHGAWVKAGKPEKWEDRPGGNVQVPAEQVESFYTLLYNAGTYLKLRVRRGEVREIELSGRPYMDVVFTVTDVPAEPEAADAPDTAGEQANA